VRAHTVEHCRARARAHAHTHAHTHTHTNKQTNKQTNKLAKNGISTGKTATWIWSPHSMFKNNSTLQIFIQRIFFLRVKIYYYTVVLMMQQVRGLIITGTTYVTQSQCSLYFKIFIPRYFAYCKMLPRKLQHVVYKKRVIYQRRSIFYLVADPSARAFSCVGLWLLVYWPAGSNPAGGVRVCLLWVLRVVR